MKQSQLHKLLQKQMTRQEFLGLGVFAIGTIFGVTGVIRELLTHAATPHVSLEPETGTLVAPATSVPDSTASGGKSVTYGAAPTPSPAPTPTPAPAGFTLGATKPKLLNPDAPTAADNVGAAFGWNGVALQVMNGDQTIPANTTWSNRLIHGYVNFTDATSRLVNSVVDGRAAGGTFRAGLINGGNGGTLDRCTIRATATSATNYLNGLNSTGGTWTLTRCDISRVVDSIHVGGSGGVKALGCQMHDYSFWDDDPAHASDIPHPLWSHGDVGIQRLSGNANTDRLEGCSIQGFFDTTGVAWSGGTWGSGTASGGTIGKPATALNGGYPNRNYSNLISYTGIAPYTGMTFLNNWIDGGNHPSGMIQMTVSGNHVFRLEGNRFGLGGQPGGSANKIYLCSYASSSQVDFGTAKNVYDTIADVPVALRGTPLAFSASGASVTL